MTYETGPSDDAYDDFKSSYSFKFMLNVHKNGLTNTYFYNVYHYRSYVEFYLSLQVPKIDPRKEDCMNEPDDEVFSDKNICSFSYCFCKNLLERMEEDHYKPKPFVKWADSNFLLFGFMDGEYFCDSYKDQEEYEKEKERKLAIVG